MRPWILWNFLPFFLWLTPRVVDSAFLPGHGSIRQRLPELDSRSKIVFISDLEVDDILLIAYAASRFSQVDVIVSGIQNPQDGIFTARTWLEKMLRRRSGVQFILFSPKPQTPAAHESTFLDVPLDYLLTTTTFARYEECIQRAFEPILDLEPQVAIIQIARFPRQCAERLIALYSKHLSFYLLIDLLNAGQGGGRQTTSFLNSIQNTMRSLSPQSFPTFFLSDESFSFQSKRRGSRLPVKDLLEIVPVKHLQLAVMDRKLSSSLVQVASQYLADFKGPEQMSTSERWLVEMSRAISTLASWTNQPGPLPDKVNRFPRWWLVLVDSFFKEQIEGSSSQHPHADIHHPPSGENTIESSPAAILKIAHALRAAEIHLKGAEQVPPGFALEHIVLSARLMASTTGKRFHAELYHYCQLVWRSGLRDRNQIHNVQQVLQGLGNFMVPAQEAIHGVTWLKLLIPAANAEIKIQTRALLSGDVRGILPGVFVGSQGSIQTEPVVERNPVGHVSQASTALMLTNADHLEPRETFLTELQTLLSPQDGSMLALDPFGGLGQPQVTANVGSSSSQNQHPVFLQPHLQPAMNEGELAHLEEEGNKETSLAESSDNALSKLGRATHFFP